MSLPPTIYRDIGDESEAAERLIWRAFLRHLDSGTTPVRAMMRAATDTGVSRTRVIEVVRKNGSYTGI